MGTFEQSYIEPRKKLILYRSEVIGGGEIDPERSIRLDRSYGLKTKRHF
jgi:hypothetical protein